jgi:tetratricopeptide (TPR) repeat protein
MRLLTKLIILMLFSSSFFAQEWKETLALAREKYRSKEYPMAYELYSKVASSAPKEVNIAPEFAQAAYKAKDYENAMKNYLALNKKNPKNKSAVQHNLGNSFFQQKEYSKAIESYKKALRLNPNDQATRYNLALALSKKNDHKKKPKQNNSKKNQPQTQNSPPAPKNEQPKNRPSESPQPNQNQSIKKDQTDRMLDDLMKQEMNTKKNKNKANTSPNNSTYGKDW